MQKKERVVDPLFLSLYRKDVLLGDDEEVLLLALLGQHVLAVEQVGGGDEGVGVGQLFLVDAHAAALGELAHLALRGEAGGVLGEQVDGLGALARGTRRAGSARPASRGSPSWPC